ncbi:CobW family GTP-binding protein [Halococcus agarilyticus]|uniref:CobW family GTP-binding protein n=1 Tax=Halococcus agarilyticus TaxID=1232219 RepID=UPI000677C9E9|nr:GTP-binding protein [Halococcus agarilyticus]
MTNGSTETIPVTVVSGPLGAGKTTLLNRVLDDPGGRDVAVIVNDMGEVNVDADLLDRSTGDDEPGIVDLSNGCICCRLRDDLLTEAARLAETREFDCLVVESSGISEPIPVARTFIEGSADSEVDPTEFYRLDTMVSVIDAYGFWKEFDAGASLPGDAGSEGDRPLADVLIEAIEFCDVLLLNKCDMVPDEQLGEIEATIRTLQPRAELVRTEHADIDPDSVLDTGRFDFAAATRSAGWKRALASEEGSEEEQDDHDHAAGRSAADTHGVSSFVYARDRPFHPERLDAWLDSWAEGLIRAKGVFRLAGRDDVMGLNQAGPSVQAGPIGEWSDEDDRRTRLVFIGTGLDEAGIVDGLDACLLDDGDPDDRAALDDPFPTV